jgi:3-keto-5-aminohexanoate cleavage enzyme
MDPTPVIIEAAINGATPKTRNPHVPRSPEEIAADGIICLEAGAAIVHNHNEEPVVGGRSGVHNPEPYAIAWRAILAKRPEALLYPTMASGGPHTTIEERYAHLPALCEAGVLRVGLVDPGCVNVGGTDKDGLPQAIDATYINTFADARYMFDTCERLQLGPSISNFEPGFVRVLLRYAKAGRMPKGALVKFYFGGENANFGLPPTLPALEAYLDMIKDTGLPWSVAVLGGDCVGSGMARLALERGGHVRIGLEDYAGPRTPTNRELVEELVKLANAAGRPVADGDQAAAILGLPRGR